MAYIHPGGSADRQDEYAWVEAWSEFRFSVVK
jgi:hypothetical protein